MYVCHVIIRFHHIYNEAESEQQHVNRSHKLYSVNVRLSVNCVHLVSTWPMEIFFCGIMNMPLPRTIFGKNYTEIGPVVNYVAFNSMKESAEKSVIGNDSDSKMMAAFDGTWQKGC